MLSSAKESEVERACKDVANDGRVCKKLCVDKVFYAAIMCSESLDELNARAALEFGRVKTSSTTANFANVLGGETIKEVFKRADNLRRAPEARAAVKELYTLFLEAEQLNKTGMIDPQFFEAFSKCFSDIYLNKNIQNILDELMLSILICGTKSS